MSLQMPVIYSSKRPLMFGVRQLRNFSPAKSGLVGQGGEAEVYRQGGRCGVPLIIKKYACGDALFLAKNEGARLCELDHPGIVKGYGYGADYVVMEYFNGRNLSLEQTRQPLSVIEAVDLLLMIATPLAYLHERGLVHGDLKPKNILYDGETIKLCDLSSCRLAGERLIINGYGTDIGTWHYFSPSRKLGHAPVPTDDLYGLGLTFIQLLSGKPIPIEEKEWWLRRTIEGSNLTSPLREIAYRLTMPNDRVLKNAGALINEIVTLPEEAFSLSPLQYLEYEFERITSGR